MKSFWHFSLTKEGYQDWQHIIDSSLLGIEKLLDLLNTEFIYSAVTNLSR